MAVVRSRKLPHLEVAGATYFVTFRCHSKFQLPPQARGLVITVIQEQDRRTIDLGRSRRDARSCTCDLSGNRTLHPQPGASSHQKSIIRQINQILGRQGRIWLVESFDHIIRHAHELEEKTEYIRQNPAKQGLEDNPNSYRWLFVKESTG